VTRWWRWFLGFTVALVVADVVLLSTADVTPLWWWVSFILFLVAVVFYLIAAVVFMAARTRRCRGAPR
jgi:hypothetical protein